MRRAVAARAQGRAVAPRQLEGPAPFAATTHEPVPSSGLEECWAKPTLDAATALLTDYHTVARKFGPGIWPAPRSFRALWEGPAADCGPISGAIVADDACESKDIPAAMAAARRAEDFHFGARAWAVRCRLHGGPQSRAARSRGGARRPRAGAGRRRDRQDAGSHHPHRPYPVLGPRARLANPGRHLHQQGRARDEGAHRPAGRRRGGRHAVARHLPRHRRQDPAPARRAGGPQVRLHHPRCGRPGAPRQAGDRKRGPRQGPLARAAAGRPHRRLEEPGAHARQGAARGGLRLCRGQGRGALCRLSEAPEGAQRGRLRRPAAGGAAAVPREPGRARGLPEPVPLHAGRRVPGHQRRPVPVAAAAGRRLDQAQHLLRRRRRPVDLRLARRRGRQHPALRGGLPGRHRDPAGAQLPLDRAHPGGRLGAHRPQQGPPRQDALHRRRHGRARVGGRRVGRRGGGPHHRRGHRGPAQGRPAPRRDGDPGAGLLPDARLRGSLRHAGAALPRRSAARASTSARRSRTPSPTWR